MTTQGGPHAFVHFASPDAAKRAMNAAAAATSCSGAAPCAPTAPPRAPSAPAAAAPPTPSSSPTSASTSAPSSPATTSAPAGPAPPAPEPPISSSTLRRAVQDPLRQGDRLRLQGHARRGDDPLRFQDRIPARDIADVRLYTDRAPLAMLLQLTSAPFVSYRTADDDIHTSVPFNLLDDEDPWIRTTDFTPTGAVGRCSSYKISLSPRFGAKLERALDYLRKRRIPDYRPNRPLVVRPEPDFGFSPATDHFFSIHHAEGVGFPILFLVNALVHKEWLLNNPKLLRSSKLADDNAEVRRLVITPTKAYCIPPAIELSNRVLRRDITSNSYQQKTTVFKRVKSILMDGFYLCGRKYSFLAFSSNQLRDRSAWFFAEDSKTTVAAITKWMGRFSNRNVAKCAARMGQCFSSTYATVEVPLREVNPVLPDIEGNGYIFSDGIGRSLLIWQWK
uniref:RNA-dependent RNA polymerase n=1 Tax=Ananas comosus var. bracteatus TaxID=296719 RepID=A0A6V7PW25_ANACO|nr:unnamed protein product [Ananas comosus var. bracteatus]